MAQSSNTSSSLGPRQSLSSLLHSTLRLFRLDSSRETPSTIQFQERRGRNAPRSHRMHYPKQLKNLIEDHRRHHRHRQCQNQTSLLDHSSIATRSSHGTSRRRPLPRPSLSSRRSTAIHRRTNIDRTDIDSRKLVRWDSREWDTRQ